LICRWPILLRLLMKSIRWWWKWYLLFVIFYVIIDWWYTVLVNYSIVLLMMIFIRPVSMTLFYSMIFVYSRLVMTVFVDETDCMILFVFFVPFYSVGYSVREASDSIHYSMTEEEERNVQYYSTDYYLLRVILLLLFSIPYCSIWNSIDILLFNDIVCVESILLWLMILCEGGRAILLTWYSILK